MLQNVKFTVINNPVAVMDSKDKVDKTNENTMPFSYFLNQKPVSEMPLTFKNKAVTSPICTMDESSNDNHTHIQNASTHKNFKLIAQGETTVEQETVLGHSSGSDTQDNQNPLRFPQQNHTFFKTSQPTIYSRKNLDQVVSHSQAQKCHFDTFEACIRYMDYRRLCRQLNGVRRKIPKRQVVVTTLFCLILIGFNFFNFERVGNMIKIGISISASIGQIIITILTILAIIFGLVVFARIQSSLSLNWAVFVSYAFIVTAIIYSVAITGPGHSLTSEEVTFLLLLYGITQAITICIVKIVIFLAPRLALCGLWCPCTENFVLIKKTNTSVSYARYNDLAGIFGNNVCCFCQCSYHFIYRLLDAIRKNCRRSRVVEFVAAATGTVKHPPFSHQLRYKGNMDQLGRPHGFGEWIEDSQFGEKLRGFWWHGYPIGPYASQEISSGSLFVNVRIPFTSCRDGDWTNLEYGVSANECSISGHFFNDLPKTFFFNPEILLQNLVRSPMQLSDHLVFDLLKTNFEDAKGGTLDWCFNLLDVQMQDDLFHESRAPYVKVYVDRNSNSLRVKGYHCVDGTGMNGCRSVNIQLKKSGFSLPSLSYFRSNDESKYFNSCSSDTNCDTANNVSAATHFTRQSISKPSNSSNAPSGKAGAEHDQESNNICTSSKIRADTHVNEATRNIFNLRYADAAKSLLSAAIRKLTEHQDNLPQLNEDTEKSRVSRENFRTAFAKRLNSFIDRQALHFNYFDSMNETSDESHTHLPKKNHEAILFKEEDQWRSYQDALHRQTDHLVVDRWHSLSTDPDNNLREVVIFVHGFNVKLPQACAQFAHLIAFSKLPSTIRPFVFSWPGHLGGIASALFYPYAKRRAHHPNIANSFANFVSDLKVEGTRRIHFLCHSAGSRAFLSGMRECIRRSLFTPVEKILSPISSSSPIGRFTSELLVSTIVLLNPDYPLNVFLYKDFSALRSICKHIAMYGDLRDKALNFSKLWNRERCLGNELFRMRLPSSIVNPSYALPHTEFTYKGCTNSDPIQSLSSLSEEKLIAASSSIVAGGNSLYKNRNKEKTPPDSLNFEMGVIDNKGETAETGQDLPEIENEEEEEYDDAWSQCWSSKCRSSNRPIRFVWLDMDVIDTTFVNKNTDTLKHGFYAISREIVDDIREVVVTGARARDRVTRLDRRRGNVFCFRVAPANVGSIHP